jgi:predicted ABC-type ATPase
VEAGRYYKESNVVATGGHSINSDQVRRYKKRGAKSFTLCLDTEPGKEAG